MHKPVLVFRVIVQLKIADGGSVDGGPGVRLAGIIVRLGRIPLVIPQTGHGHGFFVPDKVPLHHIGQHADSTLAILTQEEHRLGDSYKIWHELVGESEIDRAAFDKIRQAFWQNLAKTMG